MPRLRPFSHLVIALSAGTLALAGCKAESVRRYPIRGQILALSAGSRADHRPEVTVSHDDIPNFMPAMTMAYSVKGPSRLDGFAPGDLVTATLVLEGSDLYLINLAKTGHADVVADAGAGPRMDVMGRGDQVPDDPLQDQTGATRRLSDWRGRALAVTFVYTRCPLPDFCPLMDRRFAELQRAIAADPALRDRIHLVSVSIDPAHDIPAVLQAHAARQGTNPTIWTYATGTTVAIDHLTSRFGVSVTTDPASTPALVHNLRTAVVDRQGRLVTIHSGHDWTVEALLASLREAGAQ